jgi:C4-dicarboxylate-specific signal transduction histidine kinase
MPTNGKTVAAPSRHAGATTNFDRHNGFNAELHAPLDNVNSLSVLTASIVHEVNQPLSGITINASTCLRMLCADPPNIEGARQTARRTLRDVNRAAEVIKRLRALFTDHGHTTEAVDLNEAVRETLAMSSSELRKGRVSVQRTLADDMPLLVGDRVQLQQVILNLVRNAIEAMDGANVRAKKLAIATVCHGNKHVLLSVHDIGVGIAGQAFNDVFKPFYSTKPEGMGIGLCVSRSIVEKHGGRLWATANDGPGVTFWLSIPCTPPTRSISRLAAGTKTRVMSDVVSLACC